MSDGVVEEEGCASRVVTLCCTFSKGSVWRKDKKKHKQLSKHVVRRMLHRQLLDDGGHTLERGTLEGEHRCVALWERA
jgi:hypothetical protein